MLHINLYILYFLFIKLNFDLKELQVIQQLLQKLSRKQDEIFRWIIL